MHVPMIKIDFGRRAYCFKTITTLPRHNIHYLATPALLIYFFNCDALPSFYITLQDAAKVRQLAITLLRESDSSTVRALSSSWSVWANDITAHCVAIHTRTIITEPAVQHADIALPQSATRGRRRYVNVWLMLENDATIYSVVSWLLLNTA